MRVGVNGLFLIPGEVGGSEIYLAETLQALLRLRPEAELVFFTNQECDGFARALLGRHAGVRFEKLAVRAANRYARILAEQTLLPLRVRRAGVEVLWSPGYTMPAFAPCAQVVSLLDMQYRSHPDDLKPLARWTTHALVRMAVWRADRILAISEFSRDEIVREAGARPERIQVTPLGVDPVFGQDAGAGRRQEVRQRYLGAEVPFILSVAHAYPHKNLALLVKAFTRAAGRIPHHLLLVGKPRLGEPLLQEALGQAPAGRVHRVAGVARGDLVALFQAASVFAFPSLYEGFGLPLLEAMQAGTPALATGMGSTREVGGDTVRYIGGDDLPAWADALAEWASLAEPERLAVASRARKRAAGFTWERTAELTWQALQVARD